MKGVLSRSFRTEMSLEQMLAALQEKAAEMDWQIRESEYEGRYLSGRRGEDRIRLLDYGERKECEIYFSASREGARQYVNGTVLPAIGAHDIADA